MNTMEDNMRQSPIKIALKKAWPFINRLINTIFYFTISIIKSIARGIMDQFKGKM